jgi:hypothetical protein
MIVPIKITILYGNRKRTYCVRLGGGVMKKLEIRLARGVVIRAILCAYDQVTKAQSEERCT